ncbi:MAG: cupin domain-containing protein [Anaerovibrio sp.]|nr:cupin domain-containing protein [Anaerovibrio sp.]
MKNFNKINATNGARTELHDTLQLTGAEISVNNLPAGASVPFVHYHKKNEEIYFITGGKGKAIVDGDTIELSSGDWLRISPAARRQFFAAPNEGISYVCIQVRENSLEEYTADDATIEK